MALSFKQRIIIGMIASALVPLAIIGSLSLYLSYNNAYDLAEDGLKNAHGGIVDRVTDYFEVVEEQLTDNATHPYVINALKELTAGYEAFDPSTVTVDNSKISARYGYQNEKTKGSSSDQVDSWKPTEARARALQYLYVSGNNNAIGEKQKLDSADDGSAYSAAHARFHPRSKIFVSTFAYYDYFLFSADGRMVYSNFKEIDFMNSVNESPLGDTELGRVVKQALASNDAHKVFMSDVKKYLPSYNDGAIFGAAPIIENGKTIGALAFQLPTGHMNEMFKSLKELGETVDGFIVGSDLTYKTPLVAEHGQVGDSIPDSLKDETTKELAGEETGTVHYFGPDGSPMTGIVERLNIKGVDWALVVGIDDAELMASTYEQIYTMLIGMAIMVAVASLMGWSLAGSLVKPIISLANSFGASAKQVNEATGQVTDAVGGMIAASEETAAQSKIIRKNSGEAAGYVKSVAQAVGELNISINDISQSIGEANTLIDDAVGKAQKTDDVVRRLGEAAGKITEVVGLINGLAEQTNLLALNAAIEAARAGDAGRGFAVVADEVKKLATHTSEATVEIQDQVQSIQQVAEQSVSALHTVVEAIHRIRDSATTVSAAVEEQSGVAKQIANSVDDAANRVQEVDNNMGGIEQASNDTGVAADQVNGAAQEVKTAFGGLQTQIGGVLNQMGVKI